MENIEVRAAEPHEIGAIAGLRWRWILEVGPVPTVTREHYIASVESFAVQQTGAHHPFVAVRGDTVVGMAWLAVLPRVPSPQALDRSSGDVQCVYVVPEERDSHVGSQLMDVVLATARRFGLEHVSVHSSTGAIRMYERNGFAASQQLLIADLADR
ncbi:hypothetical protein GY21_09095 [Cryobacterium roopkundense]|uniref:GNAT superfamily N-acetyltransferase n=1 Tax=Cryobacterium roopkundense TaxID=1001240 RepID=A0A099JDW8_9MICO|nr:GNAT family N-acetyltransferase [Cryobacterium roopkundense]KGJ76451.1 hypothetical protein GY21_09095 [Cryobacterium roopkundense]MBB5640315.1 GNAT superfamily N-acetyltransferase [Cryobacterium roopkundense]